MQEFGLWIEAALGRGRWPDALDHAARVLGARCTILLRRQAPGAAFTAETSAHAPANLSNVCFAIVQDNGAPLVGQTEFDASATLVWSRMQGEFGEEASIGAFFAVIERPVDRAAFDAVASLVRSVMLAHARVAKLLSSSALKDIALDQSPWGAAIVDSRLGLHEMNAACDAILKRADGLSLAAGRLACRRNEDQASLTNAVISAINAAAPASAPVLSIQRLNGAQPYAVRVLGPKSPAAISGACLLMVIDPDQGPRSAEEIWRAMFDLTECELIIAEGLVSGRRISDIAHGRGVSVETVRSQTKRLFERLQVTSQTEAAVLLTKSAPFPSARGEGAYRRKVVA